MVQAKTINTRRIRQISVTNLFGMFNHVIPLNMDQHVTIIHGPNGFGKTMILRLLHALFSSGSQISQSYQLLENIPFDEFRVDFEDNTSFWVKKPPRLADIEHPGKREVIFHATAKEPHPLRSKPLLNASALAGSAFEKDGVSMRLTRIDSDTWQTQTGELLPSEIVEELFSDQMGYPRVITEMPNWLREMRKSVPIRFIETQRLLSFTKETEQKYAVTEDSGHLVEVIEKKRAESVTLSQSLDRTFPKRMISPTARQLQVTEDELLDKLQKLEQKRSHLMTTGLLDQEIETEFPIDSSQGIEDTTKAVLAVYAEDTEQKLGVFDELAKKIDLLTTIINDCFLYKAMTIDKEKGLVFTTQNGTNLPLEDLSSGEQHELVLFYDLLFRVTPGSLILIDEPELSLHVIWQRQFLKDIQQVTQLTNIDIILATHSPSLISDRRDLLVRLKGPEDGR
jgi:predicted ATP-binding protein involved in virulence